MHRRGSTGPHWPPKGPRAERCTVRIVVIALAVVTALASTLFAHVERPVATEMDAADTALFV